MYEEAIKLMQQGKPQEAIKLLRRALLLRSQDPALHVNLAIAYEDLGELAMAERGYRFVLHRWPGHAEATSNLGNLLARLGRANEAEALHSQRPDDPYSLMALALVQADQGRIEECVANLRRAAELTGHPAAWSEYLSYGLHVGYDEAGHKEWVRRFVDRSRQSPPARPFHGERPIRVGYVSNSWDRHSVNAFVLPILENHSEAVHVTVYSDRAIPESVRVLADEVVDMRGMDCALFDGRVRADRIDVLVDLDGHKHGSRLLCLAASPAPVCATMNGYLPDTHLTDNFNVGWAYKAFSEAPEVTSLPADCNGFVTFGSFNRACKITNRVAKTWAVIINRVPGSCLVVASKGGEANTRLRERLEAAGIPKERLTLLPQHAATRDYLVAAGEIDIHLDAWPFNGVATTCDLMYQGVPTVTRRTDEAQGQVGASILTTCGMADLVATDDEQFISLAVGLAGNLDRLRSLRAELRARMAPLLDGRPLAARLEALYRERLVASLSSVRTAAPSVPFGIPLPGDVVEAVAKRIGADRLAALWEKWTGIPCGCQERKERMNAAARRLVRWLGKYGDVPSQT